MAMLANLQCSATGCTAAPKHAARPRPFSSRNSSVCRTPFKSADNNANGPQPFSRSLCQPIAALNKPVAIAQIVEEEEATLPAGYERYEIMLILRPTLSDEERDKELAKFEAFLNRENCKDIDTIVRGRCRMAYAIKGNWDGIYVLYNCAAKRTTAKAIQQLLANPDSGSEENVLRFMILRRTGAR